MVSGFEGCIEGGYGPGKGEEEVVLGLFERDDGVLTGLGEAHEFRFSGGGLDEEVFGDGVLNIRGDGRLVNDEAHLL